MRFNFEALGLQDIHRFALGTLDLKVRSLTLGQQLIAMATAYLFSHFGCQIACPQIQPFRPDQATGVAVYLYGSLANIRGAVVRCANTAPVGDCSPPPAPPCGGEMTNSSLTVLSELERRIKNGPYENLSVFHETRNYLKVFQNQAVQIDNCSHSRAFMPIFRAMWLTSVIAISRCFDSSTCSFFKINSFISGNSGQIYTAFKNLNSPAFKSTKNINKHVANIEKKLQSFEAIKRVLAIRDKEYAHSDIKLDYKDRADLDDLDECYTFSKSILIEYQPFTILRMFTNEGFFLRERFTIKSSEDFSKMIDRIS
jgi:hypothetical protein